MFVWSRIPERYEESSQEFALRLLREAHVAVSPGSGFGVDGEGYIRFALVENEHRSRRPCPGSDAPCAARETTDARGRAGRDRAREAGPRVHPTRTYGGTQPR